MAFDAKKKTEPVVHRAAAAAHDRYGAMGEVEGFDEAFEPETGEDALVEPRAEARAFSDDTQPAEAAVPASGAVPTGVGTAPDDAHVPPSPAVSAAAFARFRRLYESRDGKMVVFEDEHGHLVAVDASRLA